MRQRPLRPGGGCLLSKDPSLAAGERHSRKHGCQQGEPTNNSNTSLPGKIPARHFSQAFHSHLVVCDCFPERRPAGKTRAGLLTERYSGRTSLFIGGTEVKTVTPAVDLFRVFSWGLVWFRDPFPVKRSARSTKKHETSRSPHKSKRNQALGCVFSRENIVTPSRKVYKPPVPHKEFDAPFKTETTIWEGALNNSFLGC